MDGLWKLSNTYLKVCKNEQIKGKSNNKKQLLWSFP